VRFPTRRFIGHRKACRAVYHARNESWNTAWGPISATYVIWHPVTRARLRYPYMIVRCNDNDCPALIGIRVSDFDAKLPKT